MMKNIKYFILSILTTLSFYSERILTEIILVKGKLGNDYVSDSINYFRQNSDFLLLLILTIALFFFYKKFYDIKKSKPYTILSLILSFFLVFGFSYNTVKDSSLVTGDIILFSISLMKYLTYFLFLQVILNLIPRLFNYDLNKIKLPKILTKFKNYYEAHPYKTTIIIILIAWLPYIISFYPAILSPDPANQIKQYYGMPTQYAECVNLIDANILITNHHPVFHTFILGGFTKLGDNLGNLNFGLFLFTCFQLFIVISAITYLLIYLKKLKLPFLYRFVVLLAFALIPVFPLYALSSVKDTIFGALLVFYLIEMHKLLTDSKYRKRDYFALCLLMLFMSLVRNNGLIIVLFSFPVLIILKKNIRIPLIIVLLLSIFIYGAHNKILLPAMHITSGSIREALSIPFQQTARYVKYYGEDLTEEEKEAIDKVLGIKTLAKRYKTNISDPVKNEFNKNATKEDLKNYFKVWFKDFFKHPGVYFDATIDTVYGYFYPNTSKWYVYHNYNQTLIKSGLDYHYNDLDLSRKLLSLYGISFPYIPLLGAIVNIGFIVWTYFFLVCYLINIHQKKLITLLLPALSLVLILVAGPVNTYFRYVFPIVLTLPLIIGIILNIKKKN